MPFSRRQFIKRTGLSLSAYPLLFAAPHSSFAQNSTRKLVVIYLRGGADTLYMVAPRRPAFPVDGNALDFYLRTDNTVVSNRNGAGRELFFTDDLRYRHLSRDANNTVLYSESPNDSLAGINLSGTNYMLHPALSNFAQLYNDKKLTIAHGVGGQGSQSHFAAQDATEWAKPANIQISDNTGWLARIVNYYAAADLASPPSFTGVSVASANALSFSGSINDRIVAVPTIDNFRLQGANTNGYRDLLRSLYQSNNRAFESVRNVGSTTLGALGIIDAAAPATAAYWPDLSPGQPIDPFYRSLRDTARIIKTPTTGVRCIAVDAGMAWDTHSDQISNQLYALKKLDTGIHAFLRELNTGGTDYTQETCVLLMSEFGRTYDANGSQATDHGAGGAYFVIHNDPTLARGYTGGRIYQHQWTWPVNNSDSGQAGWLYPGGRFCTPEQTDFRQIYAEIMTRFMGLNIAHVAAYFGVPQNPNGSLQFFDANGVLRPGQPNIFASPG